ncbi:phosphoprotein ECPP44-like isoform X2 [Humulus lupulus]|uniref:phosphoprotein ECPP44-like isoform X2 n=1 Tax=Humulus lupulus TaxID=3486 RepID=UPI002B4135D6|nr:phosphoprotein ECPP44-like isoform X2 [Humulus lupulus]
MAEENKSHDYEASSVETKDRGLFDFLKKDDHHDEALSSEFSEKVKVSEHEPVKYSEHEPVNYFNAEETVNEEEKMKPNPEKLHRSHSSSSSSSDEEECEGEEKKEKKGLKETLKEKFSGEDKKEEEQHHHVDTSVPIEHEAHGYTTTETVVSPGNPEEKKGFLEKIKDKLPGQHKKEDVVVVATSPAPPPGVVHHDQPYSSHETTTTATHHEGEAKEKKGILEKIKEKLPGYHPKTETEEKEKEKEKESVC